MFKEGIGSRQGFTKPFSPPRFNRIRRFYNDKGPIVIALLIGGEDEKTFPFRCIPMGRSVHHLPIGKSNLNLQSGNVFKTFYAEVTGASMVLISLEGLNEKDRLQEKGGYLNGHFPRLGFGDMEDLPVGIKIVRIPLYHPPVSKPNDDLIFYFQHSAPHLALGLNFYSNGLFPKYQLINVCNFPCFRRRGQNRNPLLCSHPVLPIPNDDHFLPVSKLGQGQLSLPPYAAPSGGEQRSADFYGNDFRLQLDFGNSPVVLIKSQPHEIPDAKEIIFKEVNREVLLPITMGG